MFDSLGRLILAYFDLLASGTASFLDRYDTRRIVRLTEIKPDVFSVAFEGKSARRGPLPGPLLFEGDAVTGPGAADLALSCRGADVILVLQSRRFLFRPLELPAKAIEFLDRMVRSQIDRLTPWPPEACAFGWSEPVQKGDKIEMIIAATARPAVIALADRIKALGASRVGVETADAGGPPVRVVDSGSAGPDRGRLRLLFASVLGAAVVLALAFYLYAAFVQGDRESDLDATMEAIAAKRAAINAQAHAPTDPATLARGMLDTLKHERPSAVLALEEVSRVLPDDTYLLEFRIEGNKMRIVGFSRDAPGLVALIEKSPMFQDARFFAPTTRLAGDPADRFQLEATFRNAKAEEP